MSNQRKLPFCELKVCENVEFAVKAVCMPRERVGVVWVEIIVPVSPSGRFSQGAIYVDKNFRYR